MSLRERVLENVPEEMREAVRYAFDLAIASMVALEPKARLLAPFAMNRRHATIVPHVPNAS